MKTTKMMTNSIARLRKYLDRFCTAHAPFVKARYTDMMFWKKRIELSYRDSSYNITKSEQRRFDDVAFFSWSPHASSALRPIFNEMERQGMRARWTAQPIDDGTRRLYISSVAPPPEEIRARTVWVSHGVGHEFPEPWHLECITCLLPGKYWFDLFAKRPFKRGQLITIGYPKLDILFSPNRISALKKIKERFHFNDLPYSKTVLYAPSWNWFGFPSFEKSIFSILGMANKLSINLVIKPHPLIHRSNAYHKAKIVSKEMKNTRWIDASEDIVPFYLFADILVSDVSSTLREFMLTGNTSIQLTNIRRKELLFPEVIWSSLEKLPETVVRAVDHPDEYVSVRQKWVKELFFKSDGRASERAVRIIREMVE